MGHRESLIIRIIRIRIIIIRMIIRMITRINNE